LYVCASVNSFRTVDLARDAAAPVSADLTTGCFGNPWTYLEVL